MKIKSILVDGQGWKHSEDGEIVPFDVNGEMAHVTWYRQNTANGVREYNGKYVITIHYEKESTNAKTTI